ncbi:MAG: hypothetical protein M3O36_02600 [Myxococcota bacterium]|nr:hypothetical protein [Myxococcota bacterium]
MTRRIGFPCARGARRVMTSSATALVVLSLSGRAAQAQPLEPPPPMAPTTAYGPYAPYGQTTTPTAGSLPPVVPERRSRDEEEDSGLGLEWVWLDLDLGGAYANMQSFSASTFALQKTESGGPVLGVGAGVRLLFLTLGVRARDLQLSSIGSLWQLDVEAAFHTRIWRIDPYLGARGGYDFVGSLNSGAVQVAGGGSSSDVAVHGFNVGPMIGIDYYFTKWVSLGVDADAQFLFLQRPPAPLPAGVDAAMLSRQMQALYRESGSAVGFAASGTAHLGVHF